MTIEGYAYLIFVIVLLLALGVVIGLHIAMRQEKAKEHAKNVKDINKLEEPPKKKLKSYIAIISKNNNNIYRYSIELSDKRLWFFWHIDLYKWFYCTDLPYYRLFHAKGMTIITRDNIESIEIFKGVEE